MQRCVLPLCVVVGVAAFALTGAPMSAARQVGSASSQGGGRGGDVTTSFTTPEAPATTGTGAISGVVTDAATGQPLQGALVQLIGGGTARGAAPPRTRQRTDSRGRYLFTKLPASEAYGVSAARQGYFDGAFKSAPGTMTSSRIDLRDGQWLAKVDVALQRPAAITGTVRDERGEPVVGVPVQALLDARIAGRTRRASGPSAVTDDRGMYRLGNLRPGRYLIHVPNVQVTLPDGTAAVGLAATNPSSTPTPPLNLMRSTEAGRSDGLGVLVGYFPTPPPGTSATAYPMMYHPSARSMDQAAPVSVDFGEQRTNIDVQLMLVPSFRVSGRVLGTGEALAKLPVRLVPVGAEDLGTGAEAALTMTDAGGAFTFLNVPVGEYTVVAANTQGGYASSNNASRGLLPARANFFSGSMSSGTVPGANGLNYSARATSGTWALGRALVSVGDRDVLDLAVPLVAGVVVSGHFLWDGSPSPPEAVRNVPLVRLEPADGNLVLGIPIGGMGRLPDPMAAPLPFSFNSVLPGRYTFGANILAANYVVEAIEYGGRDLLSTPLVVEGDKDITGIVVRLSSKTMSVTGFVRSAAGALADGGAVIFFPTDRAQWQDNGITAQRFSTASITASGSYRAPTLPPGEYYAAAVPDADRQRSLDPDFLLTLISQASRITLSPGSNITQDLRMIVGGR